MTVHGFAFLILVLVAATFGVYCFAASPSATLSVTVTPSGGGSIACDIGPSYIGSIPAAAVQAGFTRCAANYDFTQTQSFTDNAGTHQWSNLSTWFSCAEDAGAPYLVYYAAATEGSNVGCDTPHYSITTDSGAQVFALTYYQSDANAGHYSAVLHTRGLASHPAVFNMAEEYYIEYTMRLTTNNPYSSGGPAYSDFSTFTNVQGNPCFVSTDMEWDQGQARTGVGQAWWNKDCAGGSSGFGICDAFPNCVTPDSSDGPINTSVATWGNLTTGDGVNKFASCNYNSAGAISGLPASAFGGCFWNTIIPPFASTAAFRAAQPMLIYFESGPHRSAATVIPTSFATMIQRFTVWECPNYATGACITNPVVTTAP